jgi:NAD(P)-dependent dehydrogenase (short-subunit alcohol dehydrogenase family)
MVAEVNSEHGQSTARAIEQAEGSAIFARTDVSKEQEVKAMVEMAAQRFGKIDILFNNAAILLREQEARAHELSNETWDQTIAVNLRGYWLCAKYVIPYMLRQHQGSIIQVASPTGMLGFANLTAYSTSKGGVFALTRAMAIDYAGDNIRVNAIVPGTIDTPMNAVELANQESRQRFIAMAPAKRLGTPEDLCGLAVFLASDESQYCVGGVYMADGGQTAA